MAACDSIAMSLDIRCDLGNQMIDQYHSEEKNFHRDNAHNLGSLKHNQRIFAMALSFRSFFRDHFAGNVSQSMPRFF